MSSGSLPCWQLACFPLAGGPAASRRGEVRVWQGESQILHLVWHAHTDMIQGLAFSPDERSLACGSFDGSIKLWDLASGVALWTGWQTKGTNWLAFSPDGSLLASTGLDSVVTIWDVADIGGGTPLRMLRGHRWACTGGVESRWKPTGQLRR